MAALGGDYKMRPEEKKRLIVNEQGEFVRPADLQKTMGGPLFSPYSEEEEQEFHFDDDLDWRAADSRVNREHDDESLRDIALTETTPANWEEYDTVLIGYPIWWGIVAWPVNNFVKNNDFTGKTVIPFCTSSSSGLGQSGELLAEMANGGTWLDGQRFSSDAAADTVRDWAADLGL